MSIPPSSVHLQHRHPPYHRPDDRRRHENPKRAFLQQGVVGGGRRGGVEGCGGAGRAAGGGGGGGRCGCVGFGGEGGEVCEWRERREKKQSKGALKWEDQRFQATSNRGMCTGKPKQEWGGKRVKATVQSLTASTLPVEIVASVVDGVVAYQVTMTLSLVYVAVQSVELASAQGMTRREREKAGTHCRPSYHCSFPSRWPSRWP